MHHHIASHIKMKALLKSSPMALPLLAFAFFFVFLVPTTTSQPKTVTTLPGFCGHLPFPLETGYVGVGENKEVQLFYYFAESERSASEDPLLLWISGGPGCSSAAGFFFESGPLTFVIEEYDMSLPKLQLNQHRWTKELNILYVDVPVGSGFSYSKITKDPMRNDDDLVAHTYEFIKEWLKAHGEFSNSELYLGGDGYSGMPIPKIIQEILDGNQHGSDPPINIKGYVIGNPGTDKNLDFNARVTFSNRLAFVPDKLYESAVENCGGNFTGNTSEACLSDYKAITELFMSNLNWIHVLEPCGSSSTDDPFPTNSNGIYIKQVTNMEAYSGERNIEHVKSRELFNNHIDDQYSWCRNYNHRLCATWANDALVQATLGVPEGKVTNWQYCYGDNFNHTITTVIEYHKNFSDNYNMRALVYSGDHDISIPYIATQQWIDSLGLTETDSWRAWSFQNETAGYTRSFTKNNYNLTYATIKGGGHSAAETNVEECAIMVSRWMNYADL